MSQEERLEDIVQQCLARLDAGETANACLHDYPDHTVALAPLLEVAADLRRWQAPALADSAHYLARAQARTMLRERQAEAHAKANAATSGVAGQRILQVAVAVILMVSVMGTGVAAAQSTLPGSPLYSLKRGSETARLWLAADAEEQAALYLSFAARRLDEVVKIAQAGKTPDSQLVVEFSSNYEQALQRVKQAPPAARTRLLEQYRRTVQQHQERLQQALAHATIPSGQAVLRQVFAVTSAAESRGDLVAGAAQNASVALLPTPVLTIAPRETTIASDQLATSPTTGAAASLSPTQAGHVAPAIAPVPLSSTIEATASPSPAQPASGGQTADLTTTAASAGTELAGLPAVESPTPTPVLPTPSARPTVPPPTPTAIPATPKPTDVPPPPKLAVVAPTVAPQPSRVPTAQPSRVPSKPTTVPTVEPPAPTAVIALPTESRPEPTHKQPPAPTVTRVPVQPTALPPTPVRAQPTPVPVQPTAVPPTPVQPRPTAPPEQPTQPPHPTKEPKPTQPPHPTKEPKPTKEAKSSHP